MNSHVRSLTFLFGMAPLGLGCHSSKDDERGDDSTGDTGDITGSTDASGDGSTTDDGGSTTSGSSTTTTDDGGSTDDGDPTTGGTGDLCEDYAAAYANCYDPNYAYYSLQWCQQMREFYTDYASPACLAAWEANISCRAANACGYDGYYTCQAELMAQIQACYYDGGVYNGCDLFGQLVGECVSPAEGADATMKCDQMYEDLYTMHGGGCGDAFLQMMVCISKLDCQALSDKQYTFDHCGPEIQAKNQACQ